MTNINSTKLKYSRTVQQNITGSPKFKMRKPPGQHGNRKKKTKTEYGLQIQAIKKIRIFYGIKHRYLKTVFNKIVEKKRIGTKTNNINALIGILERRLATCVLRAKFASTIDGARQLVSHGKICVNGKVVNISSFLVKVGDVISLKNGKTQENHHVLNAISNTERTLPNHLKPVDNKFHVKFEMVPPMTDNLYYCNMDINYIIAGLSK